jgi:hypothetical protein
MTYNLTLSIGRGTATGQLPLQVWDQFKDELDTVAELAIHESGSDSAQVVQKGTVRGFWDGEEEESYTITVAGADPGRILYGSARYLPTPEDVTVRGYVEHLVSNLAAFYQQEAIAVTWAEPDLVGPRY